MTIFLQGVRTANGPSWVVPLLHQQIQYGGRRLSWILGNVSSSELNTDLCTQVGGKMHQAMRRRPRDQKSKRKLIRVMSSIERLEHKCIDLSDYKRYLNQTWYKAQAPHYQRAGMWHSQKLKIQDGGGPYLEFRKNVNISGLDKDICTKFGKKMHHGHAELTTWPKVNTGS